MSQTIYNHSIKSACDTINYNIVPSGVESKKTNIPLKCYNKYCFNKTLN
ncbi:MAG: hypothetical protein LBE12_13390 [Planctomycetaceae bacterium]|nr:hypothetical protein [Planctomycetaceae bacterium]